MLRSLISKNTTNNVYKIINNNVNKQAVCFSYSEIKDKKTVKLSERSPSFRGTGGRSSVSGVIATVFGATGFAGRYVVEHLGKIGSAILIPYRGEEKATNHLKVMGDLGQIIRFQYNVRDISGTTSFALERSNTCINLIGSIWDTKNYEIEETNIEIARNIALAAKAAGVTNFIHVSTLGASKDSPSKFARTKALSEEAVLEVFPEATIVRPGPLFGWEDRLLQRWAKIYFSWPIIPKLSVYDNKISPTYVGDFAQSLVRIACNPSISGGIYELGGKEFTINDVKKLVTDNIYKKRLEVPIPDIILENFLTFTEQFLRIPRLTNDEIKFWSSDVTPSGEHPGFDFLKIKPRPIDDGVIQFIRSFRPPSLIQMPEDRQHKYLFKDIDLNDKTQL